MTARKPPRSGAWTLLDALGGLLPPKPPERADADKREREKYFRRITDEVLERCRKDEAYRREVLAAVKAAGTGKRGAVGLPHWAPAFIVDNVQEARATYVRRSDGKPITIDQALTWMHALFNPYYGTTIATLKNVYNAELKRRRQYR